MSGIAFVGWWVGGGDGREVKACAYADTFLTFPYHGNTISHSKAAPPAHGPHICALGCPDRHMEAGGTASADAAAASFPGAEVGARV